MALVASENAVSDDDGMQLFCTKYSTLISRLREEILGRQKAEADLRMLQRRLRDEVTLRESEEKRWEDQRESLRLENSRLQALSKQQQQQQQERRQERRQEQQEQHQQHHQQRSPSQAAQTPQKQSPAAATVLAAETLGGHHGARGTAAGEAAAAGASDVLIRQGQELSALRREHAELGLRHREAHEELAACREHLAKLRKANAELEVKLVTAHAGQEEAQVRLRKLQEETRQALRSASNAKAREASAASLAGRSERELQAREARLESVRREGRRMAHRAASAERELAKAEGLDATVQALTQANKDFSMRLNAEVLARDAALSEAAHAQNAEARVKQALLEAQSEIKASEAWARERQTRTLDVESELAMLHSKLEREHDEHGRTVEITEKLRAELQTMREECEALRQEKDKMVGDATEKGRKLDRTGVQLTECKKRVASSEEVLSRLRSEVVEERKAREKCHLEAMRATERLRATRHQCTQLRDRVRALEEADLRYPSRFMPHVKPSTKEVNLDAQLLSRDDEDLGVTFEQSPGRGGGGGGGGGASFTFEAREPPGAADLRGSSRSGFGAQSTPPELASPVASARGFAREPTSVSKDRPQTSLQARRAEVPLAGSAPQLGNGAAGVSQSPDMQAMRSFLAMEDQRLASLAPGSFHRGDAARLSTSLEEPRMAAPTPTPARPMEEWYRPEKHEQPLDWRFTQSSQSNELPPILPDPSLSQELASLLAAEPRVLRVPERCADVGGLRGADAIGRASPL